MWLSSCVTGAIMSKNNQYLIGGCLYLGQLLVGYMMGWTAPVIPKLQDPNQTPLEQVLTDGQSAWVGSFMYAGCIIGPYISGYLSNIIGRKLCLLFGGGVTLVGFMMLALAKHVAVVYTGRVVTGLGIGTLFVINLVYIGEMASPKIRGRLLTMTGFSGAFGILVVYSIGPFVSYAATAWIAVGLAAIYNTLIFFIPETPVYQIMCGKNGEAMATLTWLGRKEDIDNVIAAATEKPKSKISQLTEMFTVQTNRKALFIILTLLILQQMSGVVIVIFFVTTIFDQTGLTMESHISTIIIGVTQVFAAAITPLIVERTGRKSLLLFTTAGCTLSLAALGIYFYLFNTYHPAAIKLQWLSITSLILFFIFYNIGFGIVPNSFVGEMFTPNVSSFASAFTMTIAWLFGFGVSTAFGYMVPAWGGHLTFWIYSGACAVAFFFSIVFVPETKGKTLLEIREILKN